VNGKRKPRRRIGHRAVLLSLVKDVHGFLTMPLLYQFVHENLTFTFLPGPSSTSRPFPAAATSIDSISNV
jgi:hypothetical protein